MIATRMFNHATNQKRFKHHITKHSLLPHSSILSCCFSALSCRFFKTLHHVKSDYSSSARLKAVDMKRISKTDSYVLTLIDFRIHCFIAQNMNALVV